MRLQGAACKAVQGFDDHPGAEQAVAKAIMGEIPFRGRLPIELPGFYPVGHGIVTQMD